MMLKTLHSIFSTEKTPQSMLCNNEKKDLTVGSHNPFLHPIIVMALFRLIEILKERDCEQL